MRRVLYERRKRKSQNLDYDDLLTEWIRLLDTSASARERFTAQFRYVLVDEYQDTNRLQFDIIKLLSSRNKNILAVGDDFGLHRGRLVGEPFSGGILWQVVACHLRAPYPCD